MDVQSDMTLGGAAPRVRQGRDQQVRAEVIECAVAVWRRGEPVTRHTVAEERKRRFGAHGYGAIRRHWDALLDAVRRAALASGTAVLGGALEAPGMHPAAVALSPEAEADIAAPALPLGGSMPAQPEADWQDAAAEEEKSLVQESRQSAETIMGLALAEAAGAETVRAAEALVAGLERQVFDLSCDLERERGHREALEAQVAGHTITTAVELAERCGRLQAERATLEGQLVERQRKLLLAESRNTDLQEHIRRGIDVAEQAASALERHRSRGFWRRVFNAEPRA